MSDRQSDFEEGLAAVIAEYVANYKFFQTDRWFYLSCEFRKQTDHPGLPVAVSDMSVDEVSTDKAGDVTPRTSP